MKITELSKQLGISRELLHRHIKRGCPTDSVEAALSWRSKNLDITQTKQGRITGNTGGKKKESKVHRLTIRRLSAVTWRN